MVSTFLTNERSYIAMVMGLQSCVRSCPKLTVWCCSDPYTLEITTELNHVHTRWHTARSIYKRRPTHFFSSFSFRSLYVCNSRLWSGSEGFWATSVVKMVGAIYPYNERFHSSHYEDILLSAFVCPTCADSAFWCFGLFCGVIYRLVSMIGKQPDLHSTTSGRKQGTSSVPGNTDSLVDVHHA